MTHELRKLIDEHGNDVIPKIMEEPLFFGYWLEGLIDQIELEELFELVKYTIQYMSDNKIFWKDNMKKEILFSIFIQALLCNAGPKPMQKSNDDKVIYKKIFKFLCDNHIIDLSDIEKEIIESDKIDLTSFFIEEKTKKWQEEKERYEEKIRKFEEQIKYQPGNLEYYGAKNHFEKLTKKIE